MSNEEGNKRTKRLQTTREVLAKNSEEVGKLVDQAIHQAGQNTHGAVGTAGKLYTVAKTYGPGARAQLAKSAEKAAEKTKSTAQKAAAKAKPAVRGIGESLGASPVPPTQRSDSTIVSKKEQIRNDREVEKAAEAAKREAERNRMQEMAKRGAARPDHGRGIGR
jgi:hypothetical protein